MRRTDWFAATILISAIVIGSFAAVGVHHIGTTYMTKPAKLACYLSEAMQ